MTPKFKPLVPKYTKVIRLTKENVEEVKEFLGKYDQVHPLPKTAHKSNMGIIFDDKAVWFDDYILNVFLGQPNNFGVLRD